MSCISSLMLSQEKCPYGYNFLKNSEGSLRELRSMDFKLGGGGFLHCQSDSLGLPGC